MGLTGKEPHYVRCRQMAVIKVTGPLLWENYNSCSVHYGYNFVRLHMDIQLVWHSWPTDYITSTNGSLYL